MGDETTADRVQALVDALDFPPDDARARMGVIALECAQYIDRGEVLPDRPHGPRSLLGDLLEGMTSEPNRPHDLIEELQVRRIRRLWDAWTARHSGDDDVVSTDPPTAT